MELRHPTTRSGFPLYVSCVVLSLLAALFWIILEGQLFVRQVVYYSSEYNGTEPSNDPLLTLSTTCGSSAERVTICKNTIMNWAKLNSTSVKLILFDTNPELVLFAEAFGWMAVKPPRTSYGLPVFKEIFLRAQQLYDTPFYGYANGDILFADDLLITLRAISGHRFRGNNGLLIIGRRTNFNLTDLSSARAYGLKEVRGLARQGALFQYNAQDYFITTRNSFRWNALPDFVVGRVAYDNWIVTKAILDRILVVDATSTILALHQTGKRGNFEGHLKARPLTRKWRESASINKKLAGKRFNYDLGRTFCSDLVTKWSPDGRRVLLETRHKWVRRCILGFRSWKILPFDVRFGAPSSDSSNVVQYRSRITSDLIDDNKEYD